MATSCAAPAADKIKSMFPADFAPKIAIIMGSGCGGIAAAIESPTTVSYGDLPGFPVSTVQGHAGNLLLGKLNGIPIIGLQGRVHYYEGNPRAMMIERALGMLLSGIANHPLRPEHRSCNGFGPNTDHFKPRSKPSVRHEACRM